jgi:hypothetical protein
MKEMSQHRPSSFILQYTEVAPISSVVVGAKNLL